MDEKRHNLLMQKRNRENYKCRQRGPIQNTEKKYEDLNS
jgi:hypothetical protein